MMRPLVVAGVCRGIEIMSALLDKLGKSSIWLKLLMGGNMNYSDMFLGVFTALAGAAASWAAVKTFSAQTSPDVIVYIRSDNEHPCVVYLVAQNIGGAPAYSIKFNHNAAEVLHGVAGDDMARPLLASGIEMLAPGESRSAFIPLNEGVVSRWEEHGPIVMRVTYSSVYGNSGIMARIRARVKQRGAAFPLEVGSFRSNAFIDSATVSAIKSLTKEVKALSR